MHLNWKYLWNYTVYRRCKNLEVIKCSLHHKNFKPNCHMGTIKRMCSSLSPESSTLSHSVRKNFFRMLLEHRQQAHSSIIVEVKSYYSLYGLCMQIEKFAKPKNIFYYKTKSEKEYFLFEFENSSNMRLLLNECKYFHTNTIPVCSRMLSFDNKSIDKENSLLIPCTASIIPSEENINKKLLEAEDMTQQMLELKRCEQLSELDVRLRFFVCSLIEDCISGLFPHSVCLPFGSAVNGFGCHSGDLDINLELSEEQKEVKTTLQFISKKMLSNERMQIQCTLETFAKMLKMFVPGVSHMIQILNARVPILKFQHDVTDILCDLSMSNSSAVDIAELLFVYGELDPHIRPLVYTIRRWASKNGLTSDVPNAQITNFSLLLMVIFFLQKHPHLQLPSMHQLKKLIYENSSEYPTIDCSKIFKSEVYNLEVLLKEFFAYYATFDFKKNAISLLRGQITPKPNYDSLYIHNPVEIALNVSKNVSLDELNDIVEAMGTALWQLEKNSNTRQTEPWGLLRLFDSQDKVRYWHEWEKTFQIKNLFPQQKNNISKHSFAYEIESNPVNNLSGKREKKLKKRK